MGKLRGTARNRRVTWGGISAGLLLAAGCASGSAVVARSTTSAVSASTSTVALPGVTTSTAGATTTVSVVPTTTTTTTAAEPAQAGATRLRMRTGPFTVASGQNAIEFAPSMPQPTQSGWIVRMAPNLERADGSVPPVDVIHLHHGVWLNASRQDATSGLPERFLAAGEEKTITSFPAGFGYRYERTDRWVLSYMLHNLFPTTEQLWITYDLDLIPDGAPQAAGIVPVHPVWMDVQNGSAYPVFDVLKASGTAGRYTYPDNDPAYPRTGGRNEWVVARPGVLIGTAVHLHPGGLYGDLQLRRAGRTALLFRSEAHYFEPAGAVSWDVAMTATLASWRVAVKAGDVLRVSVTYDSARASWYESMGIMVAWMADAGTGADPFTTNVNVPGQLTHGHLAENDHHGGEPAGLPDARTAATVPAPDRITIDDFTYAVGDTSEGNHPIPQLRQGQPVLFDNLEASRAKGIWHTVTACKLPCNGATGIASPLADADVPFDSGELGTGGPPTANRTTWAIPSALTPGTYAYFCRIHPFMRGAFQVTAP